MSVEEVDAQGGRRLKAGIKVIGVTAASFGIRPLLSPRQRAVLLLLIAGKAPKDMERELGITGATVRFHAAQLYKRFGVRNQREMLALVARGQWTGQESKRGRRRA